MSERDESSRFLQALGEAIRQARLRRGLSQEELGFESDLDRTYISGVERGVRNPTIRSMLRICRALGVRPSALLKKPEDVVGI